MMEKTLNFLSELKIHNDPAWFMDHIGEYERAKTEVFDLAYLILDELASLDPALNREIDVGRFISSLVIIKPKKNVHYLTYFDLSISPLMNGGNEPVYRIHIDPEGSYISVLFVPDVFGLQITRSFIIKNISELNAALLEAFSAGFLLNDLKKGALPKGYQAGVIGEDYMKLPFYELTCPIDFSKGRDLLISDIISSFALAVQFLQFFRKALGLV